MTRWTAARAGWGIAMLMAMVLVAPARGQDGFTARVLEDGAEVRAGAGTSYYLLGQLRKDTLVTVEDRFFEWYKIAPPEGIFSYVEKKDVDAAAGAAVGVVNRDRTPVKAASLGGPGESYRRQVDLSKGEKVQIVADEATPDSSFYKIKPPKGAYVFVRVSAVKRVDDAGAQVNAPTMVVAAPIEAVAIPQAAPEPVVAVPPMTTAAPTPDDTAAPVSLPPVAASSTAAAVPTAPVAGPVTPATSQLAILEARLEDAQKLPLEQQPINELLADYEALYQTPNLPVTDRRTVLMRIIRLKRNAALASTLTEISQVQKNLSTPEYSSAPQAPVARFDAVGQLLASGVYDGTNLPRLYRLVAPSSMQTIAYIRPISGTVNATAALGRIVGVVGQSRHDSALKLRLLEAEQIVVLSPQEQVQTGAVSSGY